MARILESPVHCDIETGLLGALFHEAVFRSCEASVSQSGHLNVIVLLLSCASGPLTPLS